MNEMASKRSYSTSNDQTTGETASKSRLMLACTKCKARKVKCDRVHPCHACCIRGQPSDCVFLTVQPEDHEIINQSYAIRKLRSEVEELKEIVTARNREQPMAFQHHTGSSTSQPNTRYRALETIFAAIASAPDEETQDIVRRIKSNHNLEEVATSIAKPKRMTRNEALLANAPGKKQSTTRKGQGQNSHEMRRRAGRVHPQGRQQPLDTPISKSMLETNIRKEELLGWFLHMDNSVAPPSRKNKIWLYGAVELRGSSPVLQIAFECIPTAYYGKHFGDMRMLHRSKQIYLKVLNGLQQAIWSPVESRAPGTLFAIILLAKFEVLEQTLAKALANHCIGALKVVELRGPHCHKSGAEHQLFIDNRAYWIMTAIAYRSPTFLSTSDWKTIPWSNNLSSKDFQQYLLDHFADIPTLLAEFDTLAGVRADASSSCSQVQDLQTQLCSRLAGIEGGLRQWKREHADPKGESFEVAPQVGGPTELRALSAFILPVFQCRDINGDTTTPTQIRYPDVDLAIVLCIYYSALLIISLFDIRTEGKIESDEQYNLACIICRGMQYFTDSLLGENILLVLFGLRVAYDTFPEGSSQKQWVKDVFLLIGEGRKLNVCATLLQDYSVVKNGCFSVSTL